MNRMKSFDGLYFDDDFVPYEQICPKACLELQTTID